MAKAAAKSPALASAPALPPVIVIAGEEIFLREQFLAEIRHALFGNDDPGMGLVRIDPTSSEFSDSSARNGPMAAILDEIRTPSMFTPEKLVIVDPADALFKKRSTPGAAPSAADAGDDLDDSGDASDGPAGSSSNREILERYLAQIASSPSGPPAGATLVLIASSWLKTTRLHKAVEKSGGFRLAAPISLAAVPAWISRRAPQAHGKSIDPAASARLAELVGPDLQRLENELAKLALYESSASITVAAVDALVGFQHEQKIWEMINALAGRDAATALKKIDEIWAIDSKIGYTASGAVFFWLVQVLKARELIDRRLPDAVIGRDLKLWPPDRAQKVLALARTWGLPGAARWSRAILEMDLANKSSLGEPRRNMEKFIAALCLA